MLMSGGVASDEESIVCQGVVEWFAMKRACVLRSGRVVCDLVSIVCWIVQRFVMKSAIVC